MGLLLKFVSLFGIKVTHEIFRHLPYLFFLKRQRAKFQKFYVLVIVKLKIFFVPENVDIVSRCFCFLFFPQLVWTLYCDIVCLDYDGNVTDACVLSLLAALNNS